jgi:diguanylate cyclase (GGDEF)-like protein
MLVLVEDAAEADHPHRGRPARRGNLVAQRVKMRSGRPTCLVMDASALSWRLPHPGQVGSDGGIGAPAGLEIVAELGRGAQTVVYRVRRGADEYALKVLLTSSGDDESVELFRREAATLACVGHPGIVKVHDVGVVDGRPYLVMDLVEGRRLSDVIADGPPDEERVVAIGVEVAEALAAAHRAGLVHRDVKPDNILITPDGVAHVIDFGLAARTTDEHSDAIAGTLIYTAPEQSGMLKRAVDGRADLYALGAVLLECATGVPPFTADDSGDLLRMHLATPAPDARSRRPDLSPVLAEIIAKLLAKDPDDRYQSGTGLAADLRALPATGMALGRRDEPAGVGYDPPLTGRDADLSAVCAGWDRARHGRGGVALITGASGSGKSRLAREVASRARRDDYVVLRASCAPEGSMPMAPLRTALGQYLKMVDRLPAEEKATAINQVVDAVGEAGSLLKTLSPGLSRLLDAPDLDEERQDQLTAAVATFLARLARHLGGLLLCIEDVQWLDEPSRRVLGQLAGELPKTPLFVLTTVRDDDTSVPAVEVLRAELGTAVDVQVTLGTLDEPAMRSLISAVISGMTGTDELVELLLVRSAGNPFMLLEYLKAIVDAGLVRPRWGRWLVDTEGLDQLHLPDNAVDLVVKRLDALDPQSRRVLAVCAAFRGRFATDLVAEICGIDGHRVVDVVTLAVRHRLVERRGERDYTLLHGRIRTALLDELDAAELREIHARIADLVERLGSTEPEHVYALAYHLMDAGGDQPADRLVRACVAAGRQALADQAPTQAVRFLECAGTALSTAGRAADASLLQTLGLAYQRAGRSAEALATFGRALDATTSGPARASILQLTARCNEDAGRPEDGLAAVERGLAELGRPLPGSRAGRLAVALWLFILSLVVSVTGLGRGTLTGVKRERHALLASLYHSGGDASARLLQPLPTVIFVLLQRYHIVRVGDCPAAARSSAGMAVMAYSVRLHRRADRTIERAIATGVALGDPRSVAEVHWMDGVSRYGNGLDLGAKVRWTMDEHGRWLETGMYLEGVTQICWDHLMRGEVAEAAAWQQRGAGRIGVGVALADGHPFLGVAPAILAMGGRFAEASTELSRLQAAIADRELYAHISLLSAGALNALEQCDLEPMVEQVDAALARVDPLTMKIMTHLQNIVVYRTYALVELARTAPAERRGERIAAARDGVAALGKVVTRPLTRAHHAVLGASLQQICGDDAAALAELARADPLLLRVDAPLVAFEAARVRARALPRTGECERQAGYAARIAFDQGWAHRVRSIRSEFSVSVGRGAANSHTGTRTRAGTRNSSQTRGGDNTTADILRQRLSALEQVSQAAARVLDPDRLARIALDETVRILAAERAFLFLCDLQTGAVRPHLGRDGGGNDLHELTNYSSTLVDSVRHSRDALVITGTDEGVALGSQSAVIHGLRSIMAAPLMLDDRLLGVVYLDSRVAKGIFTLDDVSILAAITNHIASAMETARAAQLELAVTAADHQRELAETLRDAMTQLSGTLEPTEVLDRLLTTVAHLLSADRAWLLVPDGNDAAVRVQAVHGGDEEFRVKLDDARFSLDTDPRLAELLAIDTPVTAAPGADDPVTIRWALRGMSSWIAVPLNIRAEHVGLLILASDTTPAYDDAQSQMAAALAGQGMIAYENARLFTQVRHLATVDGLTNVANRRHFYELATHQITAANATDQPLAAMMIDIDHFKRVNDTFGHQVGDQVIRTVAERLRIHIRPGDIVGRYGGEEFALLVQASVDAAPAAADRLRLAISESPVHTEAGPVPVTISVGVTALTPDDSSDVDAVLARADQCLYRAKQAGRNRVVHDNQGPATRGIAQGGRSTT